MNNTNFLKNTLFLAGKIEQETFNNCKQNFEEYLVLPFCLQPPIVLILYGYKQSFGFNLIFDARFHSP